MPKDRYRLYHLKRAKGGVALTRTAGSALVSPDSPAAFNNHALEHARHHSCRAARATWRQTSRGTIADDVVVLCELRALSGRAAIRKSTRRLGL
jgi:hypothetical protein